MRRNSETTFVSSRYTPRSIEARRRPAGMPAARRKLEVAAAFIGQQQLLERADRRAMKAPPFIDRHQDSRLTAALRHKLRSLLETGIKHFAETRLGILDGPCLHGGPPD